MRALAALPIFGLLWLIGSVWLASPARAASLPVDPSQFPNPAALLPQNIVDSFVKTVGFAAEHRPYQPATALGMALGLDVGVEATLMKIPDDFKAALVQAGLNSGESIPPTFPIPKFHIHKGLGEVFDIGTSFVSYHGYKIIGGDVKAVLYNPEEGVTWAARFNYSAATLGFVSTKTYSPQLLISRKLDFADPYMGVGYVLSRGQITLSATVPVLGTITLPTVSGKAQGFESFMGVAFRIPRLAFKITLEGAYSLVGADTLGAKIGFEF